MSCLGWPMMIHYTLGLQRFAICLASPSSWTSAWAAMRRFGYECNVACGEWCSSFCQSYQCPKRRGCMGAAGCPVQLRTWVCLRHRAVNAVLRTDHIPDELLGESAAGGHRSTAIGGSRQSAPRLAARPHCSVGSPTTVVYAPEFVYSCHS